VSVAQSVLILLLATFFYLLFGEIAVRIAIHTPLFEWRDFRHARAAATINQAVQYDSELGWRIKPFIRTPGFNTREHGFRSNGDANAAVETGGILAVGSSFTAGSEVTDSETWPAQLQRLLGVNVNNAGQGGHQADQIILLGEQLLPLIRPQVLIVDLIPGTIIGTGYASYGWPKPYFTVENGKLIAHNSPVPRSESRERHGFDIRLFLGHSAAIDQFMAALFADFWFTTDGNSFVTISTDEVEVTCRLLERLKMKTDRAGVRLLLYLQYGGPEVLDGARMTAENRTAAHSAMGTKFYIFKRWVKDKLKPFLLNTPHGAPNWFEASSGVANCARGLNITTIDELSALLAAYETGPEALRKYYVTEASGTMGHKSAFGNAEVARAVAAAIANLGAASDQKSK
jgi:hypothetical protein